MIRLVVALPSEARPLIRRFGLARVEGGGSRVWRHGQISLVVSGIGRDAAASATDRLAADEPANEAAWLNVGIGGHRTLALGEVVLASQVIDRPGGGVWTSSLAFEPPCATATVTTVERPETDYPEETVYEMEAAGFCAAAARFTSAERIQVVKVISDNAASPPDRLTAGRVEELIEGRIETIALIIERSLALVADPPATG